MVELILELILAVCIFGTIKALSFDLGRKELSRVGHILFGLIKWFLAIFEVRIKPSWDYTFTAGPDLMWSSSSASNSDDFPFFWILYCSSRTRVTAVWRLFNICWNFAHTGAGSQTEPLWLKFQQISTDLQTAVTRVLDEQ